MPRLLILTALLLTVSGCRATRNASDEALRARALALVQQNILVDGHIDVPYRITEEGDVDLSVRSDRGDFDFERAKEGGLDAPFMSIYIPPEYQQTGGAKALADSLIDMVEGFAARWPDRFALARSVADVRANHARGLVSLPMGMENGAPIENDLANVRYFYDRGIRYITLTHGTDNQLSDSSYDTTRTWNGLSPFGEEVVREMNRLGMMIDVSHLSDSAFYDVLRVSRAPVIASHSSLRHFTPGWERNMSDEMVQALAGQGGVVMINFGSSFLRSAYQAEGDEVRAAILADLERQGLEPTSPEGRAFQEAQRKARPVGTVEDVADHIDRAVQLAGIDHVGLGSDFDGVFALPAGLQDASHYPNLVAELLRRGYTDEDVRKILGENVLRVWAEVERLASR